jgi:hypothetical protein
MTQPPPIVPGGQPAQQPDPTPPPQYGPPGPPQPQPVVVKGASPLKIVLIVLGCLAGVAVVCAGISLLPRILPSSGTGGGGGDPITVQMDDCVHKGDGFYSAQITVTNTSDRTRSAVITVEFVDANGTRLAQDIEFVNDLAPGQSSKEEALGHGAEASPFRCVIRY